MRKKIAKVINKNFKCISFLSDKSWVNAPEIDLCNDILDLIAKELPKEKEERTLSECLHKNVVFNDGYNQCLKDIKHNLGVE